MCPIEHNPQESMLTYWKDVECQKRPIFFFTLYGKQVIYGYCSFMYEKTIELKRNVKDYTQ